jgi:uncharacterized protein (DUF2384 family)
MKRKAAAQRISEAHRVERAAQMHRLNRELRVLSDLPEELAAAAIKAFGSDLGAAHWFLSDYIALPKKPIELVKTSKGRKAVKTALLRIEYGVLA